MEPYYAGWLSLVPPILAITLALKTKEVISSLLVGILAGSLIYSLGIGVNPIAGTVGTTFDLMIDNADLYIILFICLLGGLVFVISMAGGSAAYGRWAADKIKTKRLSLIATAILGVVIFIDDYFNCLTVGTVMQPLTDKHQVSRAKLSYIIDCTAAPVCMIAPISSWAAAVSSNLEATGYYSNGFEIFMQTIPLNLYALLSLAMVFIIICRNADYGPMALAEKAAGKGDLGKLEAAEQTSPKPSEKGTVADMAAPIFVLILLSVLAMLYTGDFFTPGEGYLNFSYAFGNCETSKSLVWGGFGALLWALGMFVPRKLMTFHQFIEGIVSGFKTMIPACCILFLAWTIGGVCRDCLMTPEFVSNQLSAAAIPVFLLPVIVFFIASFLSFATGTAWGTFSILIPIIVPVCHALAPELLIVSLSASLAGSVFGDNCSPISDTTILSSTGAQCDHIQHVSTQLPYALTVGGCTALGYLVAGLSQGNVLLTLTVSFLSLGAAVFLLHKLYEKSAAYGAGQAPTAKVSCEQEL